ncbi:MAG: DUF4340 domain-containing protein [Opitutales bacterium]|jgi:hypothetical protein
MRYKLTVLLAILNLAVFCLIFYVDRAQSTRNLFESSSRLILDPAFVQGLDQIIISSSRTGETWTMQRTSESAWDVTDPVHWKANPFAVQQLIFQLKALAWESRFPADSLEPAGQSLETYDLEEPPLRVVLDNGSETMTLRFGAPTEIGNRLYTMSPDNNYILVTSRGLLDILQKGKDNFLDYRIFGLETEESRVIQIQDRTASNVRVRMERDARGWRFVSPIEADADDDRVQALLSRWQNLQGRGFARPATEESKLETDAMRLTFESLNARETLSFSTADAAGGFYQARLEGYEAVFQVEAAAVEALRRTQDSLREKRILRRHSENWTSLKIKFGNTLTTLQQLENGEWQILNTNPEGELLSQPADPRVVEDVRSLLKTMEAVEFVSDAPSETDLGRFGLNSPQRIIALQKPDGKTVELSIGGVNRENTQALLYARTNEMSSVFLLRPHVLANLPLNPMHYRERSLRSLPATAEVTRIVLIKRESGQEVLLDERSTPEAWASMMGYLRDVEVDRYLRNPFADPLQLDTQTLVEWPFLLQATISYPQGGPVAQQEWIFHLTSRLGGRAQYIGDADSGLIGILPVDIIEKLDPFLADFPEDPGQPGTEPTSEESSTPGP